MILGFAVTWIWIWRARKKLPPLRTFPAIDAVPELIGRAVEMARPALMSPGAYGAELNRPQYGIAASLPIMHYIARQCAKYGCRLVTVLAYADTYAATVPIVEAAYAAEGKTSDFRADDILFYGSLEGYNAAYAARIASDNVGAHFLTGSIASAGNYGIEMANRVGAMTDCLGNATGAAIIFQALCADYLLIGEEYYAASAAISEDRTQLGSLVGTDLIKISFLVLLLIGVILTAAAPTLATQLTRLLNL